MLAHTHTLYIKYNRLRSSDAQRRWIQAHAVQSPRNGQYESMYFNGPHILKPANSQLERIIIRINGSGIADHQGPRLLIW